MDAGRPSPGSARSIVGLGHVLVGVAALVFSGVLIGAGLNPDAELEGVLVSVGLVLALAAAAFLYTAVLGLRQLRRGRHGRLSLALSIVELAAGLVMLAALVVAVQGYGSFAPWRSPLLLPALVLLALGLAGLRLELGLHRPRTPETG